MKVFIEFEVDNKNQAMDILRRVANNLDLDVPAIKPIRDRAKQCVCGSVRVNK